MPEICRFYGIVIKMYFADKDSFWYGSCRELIDQGIGTWLTEQGYAPLPKGQPPHFELELVRPGVFIVRE